jgi:peptidoglycan hydrolase-like protein with peptidoglycan-binding domain
MTVLAGIVGLVAAVMPPAFATTPAPVNLDSASCPANIVEGATGGCVVELQDLLNIHNAGIGVDGQFGAQTLAAVRTFQSETGIGVDGQVGPQTKAELYATSGRVPVPISLTSSACPANLVQGAAGGCVVELQNLLDEHGQHVVVDGQFGPATAAAVEAFQTAAGIGVDGQVGPQTKAALYGSTIPGAPVNLHSPTCPENMTEGEKDGCVTTLQSLLNAHGQSIAVDGDFGPATLAAVEAFQSAAGIGVDGQVGPQTKDALYGQISTYSPAPTPILLNSPACPTTLTQGEVDGCVTELQSELNLNGARLALDGQFGPATHAAVEQFQSADQLAVTGAVGPADKAALLQGIGSGLAGGAAGFAQAELEFHVIDTAQAMVGDAPDWPYAYAGGHDPTPGKTLGRCQPLSVGAGGWTNNGVPPTQCIGDKTIGLDCSGFTRYAYYMAGLAIGDTNKVDLGAEVDGEWDSATYGQMIMSAARPISQIDAYPGDLVFFGDGTESPGNSDHVGIYAGDVNGTPMIYAEPHTGTNVTYEPLAGVSRGFAWTEFYHFAIFA